MTYIQAFFLGLLQGVAEFLPISSSGHLLILQHYMGLGDIPPLFDILLHLATLGAVFIVYYPRIAALFSSGIQLATLRPLNNEHRNNLSMLGVIIISTIITFAMHLILRYIPYTLTTVAFGMVYTSILLMSYGIFQLNHILPWWGQSLIFGIFQGIGTLPGVSRSGSTLFAAQLCGHDRKAAGEYSFVLLIPAVLGAILLELPDFRQLTTSIDFTALGIAFVTAFITGIISLRLLVKVLHQARLYWFAFYLLPVAIFIFLKQ
jgi:undecaprenyl-diphosphatase